MNTIRHNKMLGNGLRLLVGALFYFLLAKFGMSIFSLTPSNITLLWLPSGIALIMCLNYGLWALPWIIVASFCANLEGMQGLTSISAFISTLISSSTDAGAGLVAAWLFNRYLPNGLTQAKDLIVFFLGVCIFTTTLTSVILSANLVYGGYVEVSAMPGLIRTLVLADSLGILLLYPIYQGWKSRHDFAYVSSKTRVLGPLSLIFVFVIVYTGVTYAVYFIPSILLIIAFHSRLIELSVATALSVISVTALTAAGFGPFIDSNAVTTNLNLISFLLASTLTIIGVALQNRQLALSEGLIASWKSAANTDPLTKLLNRRAFFTLANQEARHINHVGGKCFSIAMLDLDNFKQVNDRYGHAAGDMVLEQFSRLLEEHCRKIDLAARIGGEEFAVFLPNCSLSMANNAMLRINSTLAQQTMHVDSHLISVTVSIGIAALNSDSETFERVMKRADGALYKAKETRNTVISAQ